VTQVNLSDVIKSLRPWMSQLVQVAQMYALRYPPERTPPEVIEAVTVPVPYAAYLGMIGAMGFAAQAHKANEAGKGGGDAVHHAEKQE